MQGQQDSQRALFDTIDLELMIPRDHLLRRIDSKIDFDFIYDITERLYCPDNGRPSIDPVLFFRMQLISYLYGMKSDRELCREVHLNLAYRWFCRLKLTDTVPDHSSMTRIRDRFGEAASRIAECEPVGPQRDVRDIHAVGAGRVRGCVSHVHRWCHVDHRGPVSRRHHTDGAALGIAGRGCPPCP